MLGCFCTSSQQPASCFKTDGRRQAAMQSSILVYRIFQPRVKFRGICWTDVGDHMVHSRPLRVVVHGRPFWIFFAHNASTPIVFQVWGSRRFWRSCHAGRGLPVWPRPRPEGGPVTTHRDRQAWTDRGGMDLACWQTPHPPRAGTRRTAAPQPRDVSGPAGAFAQEYTVMPNTLSDNKLYGHEKASQYCISDLTVL